MSTADRRHLGYLLTAYAEDQLSPEGRAWVEELLAGAADLAAELAAIVAFRRRLAERLAGNTPPAELAAHRREAILRVLRRERDRAWWQRPRWWGTGLAAACLLGGAIPTLLVDNRYLAVAGDSEAGAAHPAISEEWEPRREPGDYAYVEGGERQEEASEGRFSHDRGREDMAGMPMTVPMQDGEGGGGGANAMAPSDPDAAGTVKNEVEREGLTFKQDPEVSELDVQIDEIETEDEGAAKGAEARGRRQAMAEAEVGGEGSFKRIPKKEQEEEVLAQALDSGGAVFNGESVESRKNRDEEHALRSEHIRGSLLPGAGAGDDPGESAGEGGTKAREARLEMPQFAYSEAWDDEVEGDGQAGSDRSDEDSSRGDVETAMEKDFDRNGNRGFVEGIGYAWRDFVGPEKAGTRPSDLGPLLERTRRLGKRMQPAPGGLRIVDDDRALDPTGVYGLDREAFKKVFATTPMLATADDPIATFAFDDDTASYDRVRMHLERGQDFEGATIRPEHFVNAMPHELPPATGPEAFACYAEAAPSPFARGPVAERTVLVSVGVVAREATPDERRPLRLVLCVDASGSMAGDGGLARIRPGLHRLLARLDDRDRVAVVAFDDRARLLAPPATPGGDGGPRRALDGLDGRGATNAAEGLALAYQVAAEMVEDGAETRVVYVTDGATLAGTGAERVLERIREYAVHGITLSVVGCGEETYAADELEKLADAGDGEHRFVGDAREAVALFDERLVPERLAVLARDAKVQVRWNPDRVGHHRLIGYEERRLEHHQFRDDRVDAGELAHGSKATALFEVVLVEGGAGPLGEVAVRYHDTRRERVRELTRPLPGDLLRPRPSDRLRLLAAAAATAEWLRAGWWSNVYDHRGSRILAELRALHGRGSAEFRAAVAELESTVRAAMPRFAGEQ